MSRSVEASTPQPTVFPSSAGPETRRPLPKRQIKAIEAARGLCATYVVVAHVVQIFGWRNDSIAEYPLLITLLSGFAHEAVICFFLLSGFSIHYASLGRNLATPGGIADYFYLRFRRIYPIFFVGVALTLALCAIGYRLGLARYGGIFDDLTVTRLAANLAFLADRGHISGTIAEVLDTNAPLWSLAYEVPYYLSYPLVWMIARRFGAPGILAWGLIASIAAVLVSFLGAPNHFSNVFSLYFAWCFGAVIAECKRHDIKLPVTRFWWVVSIASMLMLALAIRYTRLGWLSEPLWAAVFFLILGYPVSRAAWVPMTRFERPLALAAVGVVLAGLLAASFEYAFWERVSLFRVYILLIYAVLAAAVVTDASAGVVRAGSKALLITCFGLGQISYALYIVHYPILSLFSAAFRELGLSRTLAVVVLPLPFVLALTFEKYLQPVLNRTLDRWYKRTKGAFGFRPEIAR